MSARDGPRKSVNMTQPEAKARLRLLFSSTCHAGSTDSRRGAGKMMPVFQSGQELPAALHRWGEALAEPGGAVVCCHWLPFDAFLPLALRAFSTTGDSTAASSMLLPAKAPACKSDRPGLSLR